MPSNAASTVARHATVDAKQRGGRVLANVPEWAKHDRKQARAKLTADLPPSRRAALQARGPLPS
eukprot:8249815-Alexandrium_andersonii.AAC.1